MSRGGEIMVWYDIFYDNIEFLIVLSGYLLLILTSGMMVNKIVNYISKKEGVKKVTQDEKDTGFIIGKCENILILTFMLLGAYTALALIFAAKTIVRKEDMSRNSLYFLSGSMINVTYSIVVSVVVKSLLEII